jgi:hypothetical protein
MEGNFNRDDRVLVLPANISADKREKAIGIAQSRMRHRTHNLKKMGVELHRAESTSMVIADSAHYTCRRMLFFGALLACATSFISLGYAHLWAPTGMQGRALFTPDKTYLNYVYKTKVDETKDPVIDLEKEKKELEAFKSWQLGGKND